MTKDVENLFDGGGRTLSVPLTPYLFHTLLLTGFPCEGLWTSTGIRSVGTGGPVTPLGPLRCTDGVVSGWSGWKSTGDGLLWTRSKKEMVRSQRSRHFTSVRAHESSFKTSRGLGVSDSDLVPTREE